jgi:hypothetical protein
MDQVAYDTSYAWMRGAIDLFWIVWNIVGVFVLMKFILKYLGWAKRTTKRDNFDEIATDLSETEIAYRGTIDRYRSLPYRKKKDI